MKKEKQQKRPKRTKAQRVQALKTFAVDTVYDVVGSILFAIGVYTFAKSADFAPGGVSGLALICNYLWDLPIGTMTLIINIPIIIISWWGASFCSRVSRRWSFPRCFWTLCSR